jgi:hypothetical protein
MAQAKMTRPEAEKLAALLKEHGGNVTTAAMATGLPRPTMQHQVRRAEQILGRKIGQPRAAPAAPLSTDERREILRLRAEIAALKKHQAAHDGDALLAQAIIEARGGLQAHGLEPPAWTIRGERTKDSPGVPVMLLTDWHIGEVVDPAQVHGHNRFDAATADARVRQTIERAIMLGRMHAPAGGHKGGVVMLGGDFVSGWLHEELARTDWCSPMQAAAWCVSRLVWALRALRDEWGRLYVVGVPGNHGRLTLRPPGKGHAYQSFDWLIYTMVHQQLADSAQDRKTISLSVPDAGEQIVQVAGTRYLLMHGHQLGVKGGDGIIGAVGPIMRGATKVGRAGRSVGQDFDALVIGHYHTTLWLSGVIVGPTLKGYDEYARVSRFSYEPAAQLLWFSHPRWGPNSPLRVFLQDPPVRGGPAFVALPAAA